MAQPFLAHTARGSRSHSAHSWHLSGLRSAPRGSSRRYAWPQYGGRIHTPGHGYAARKGGSILAFLESLWNERHALRLLRRPILQMAGGKPSGAGKPSPQGTGGATSKPSDRPDPVRIIGSK